MPQPTPSSNWVSKLYATPEPPELGPGPRAGIWNRERVNLAVDEVCAGAGQAEANALRALAHLWHDHAEAAHAMVQRDEDDPDCCYVHAILHRREPDYSNARYWFRRVPRHPTAGELASRVKEFLESRDVKLATQLLPGGRWEAMAFVDACEAAAGPSDAPKVSLLREVQRIEFEILMEHLVRDRFGMG